MRTRLYVVILAVAVLLPVWQCQPGIGAPGTLRQEIAAARRAGLPLTAKELIRRPPVPAADNAAPLYRKLDALLKAKPLTEADSDIVEDRAMKADAAAADLAAAKAILARRRDAMDLIHRAAAKRDCDFARKWEQGPALYFPEYRRMRTAGRLLASEANVHLAEGHADSALRTCAMVGKVAWHASSDPHIIAQLDASTIQMVGLKGIEAVLAERYDAATASAAAATASTFRTRPLAEALRGEAVMAMVDIDMIRTGGPDTLAKLSGVSDGDDPPRPVKPSPQLLDANAAYLIWFYRSLADALSLPYPRARTAAARIGADLEARVDRRDLTILVGSFVLPMVAQFSDGSVRASAHRDAVRAAAAVLAWRARHRALPPSLAVCMNPVPADPFDGQPLRYRQEGKGFVVYSVGPTGKYAGAPKVPGKPFRETVVRWR